MKFEGNPFFWGFDEQRSIETLAKRAKAIYSKPRELVEKNTSLENYFEETFGASPNPAFITGTTPIEQIPYIVPTSSTISNDEECNEDIDETDNDEGVDNSK